PEVTASALAKSVTTTSIDPSHTSSSGHDADDPTAGASGVSRFNAAENQSHAAPGSSSIGSASIGADAGINRGGRSTGMDVAVDSDRQQITFKFSYTSAIIVGFAI